MADNKSTILIGKDTRSLLTKIGRKDQTYDEIIRLLIRKNNRDSPKEDWTNLCSSESVKP